MTDFSANSVPASAIEFGRWMKDVSHEWPHELRMRGERALLTLESPVDNPGAHQSPAFMEASRQDLMAFAEAYGRWSEWKKRKQTGNPAKD